MVPRVTSRPPRRWGPPSPSVRSVAGHPLGHLWTLLDAPGRPRPVDALALLAALLDGVRDAAEVGDLAAARVAHEAAGRLLGIEASDAGAVVDLDTERRRRDR